MKALILILAICGTTYAYKNCCESGEILKKGGYCGSDTFRMTLNCTYGRMILRHVLLDGDKLSTEDAPTFVFVEDPEQYCVATMYVNETVPSLGTLKAAIVCFQDLNKHNDLETSGILTLISVVFLVATFIVYCYLPELRDLQGLCYMCLCMSMAIGFLSLGILQISPGFIGEICTATGFTVYFWMTATFFWMNVICINVYRTIVNAIFLKKTQKRQFYMYSIYAWGTTLAFFIVVLITNFVEGGHWKPGFNSNSCWFHGRTETWIFFYGPIACLILSNLILFVLSSFKLLRDTRKYEVSKMNNLKHRFRLSLKLFLVMGISWIFEIISFAHNESHIIWKIADIFNCLQGVVIFIILVVLRKRAMLGLANAGCCLFITKRLADKLSPHDESCDEQMIEDDADIRIN